jgi:hypothetical protein
LHVVFAFDSTQVAEIDRLKLYINGVLQPVTITVGVALNWNGFINSSGYTHYVGAGTSGVTSWYFDGYLSEITFIDGQALTPSLFGEFNADGVWVPKKYAGTYGTNGFYLPFDDGTSATTLGYDRSGNGNNWSATGISTTSGATYDWMDDTPTNNFATLSPLVRDANTGNYATPVAALSDGNLAASVPDTETASSNLRSTIKTAGGRHYAEFVATVHNSGDIPRGFGIYSQDGARSTGTTHNNAGLFAYHTNGGKNIEGTMSAYGATWAVHDVIGVAYSSADNTLEFFKNGVSQGQITGIPSGNYYFYIIGFAIYQGTGDRFVANFGQRPFAYTPPTGFLPLCTKNLPVTSITTSGSFTGNLISDGPFVWLNGSPETMTINGNAVTWGTHADKTAGGFKVRSSSSSYNNTGTNTYSVTYTGNLFGDAVHAPNTAKGNP